jgi:hypothetical protein
MLRNRYVTYRDLGWAVMSAWREYLRLKARRLRPAVPYSEETKALRTVSRTRTDLVAARVAATNQLAALLDAHWPGAKEVFADVASPIGVAFLTRYPTPASAANLDVKRMAAFCARHAYSGRRSPEALLERMRNGPGGSTGPVLTRAMREAVLAHVAVLAALNTAIKSLDRSVAGHLADHPDGKVFASFPRCRRSTPRRSSPSGAIPATHVTGPTPWPPSADWCRSPAPPANIAASTSDGHVINACASLSPPSPTTVGTKASGPQISTDAPVPAARITSTQSGFLLEPGCGLSGAAGAPARPTTVRFTRARRNTSPRRQRPEFAAKG